MTKAERFREWPAWLVIDLYPVHQDKEALAILKAKNITPLFIEGGCSSKLQFHDVYVNHVFKRLLRDRFDAEIVKDAQFVPDKRYIRDTISGINTFLNSSPRYLNMVVSSLGVFVSSGVGEFVL